jgi:flagellar export protein FliJ
MADLDALIRLRKHAVDEKQRAVAQLYREAENLEKQKKVVEDQMAHEKRLAEEMNRPEAISFYTRYADGARKKIAALQVSIKKMEGRIEAAQEDMRTAFAEMKKIQITQTRREKREEKAIQKKESDLLDDIAIDQYRRKVLEDEK